MRENQKKMKIVEAILKEFLRIVQNAQLNWEPRFYSSKRYSYAYVMQYSLPKS